jgi:hypothetical protein
MEPVRETITTPQPIIEKPITTPVQPIIEKPITTPVQPIKKPKETEVPTTDLTKIQTVEDWKKQT